MEGTRSTPDLIYSAHQSPTPPAAIETHATAPDAEALARVGSEVLAVEELHPERAGEVGDWDWVALAVAEYAEPNCCDESPHRQRKGEESPVWKKAPLTCCWTGATAARKGRHVPL